MKKLAFLLLPFLLATDAHAQRRGHIFAAFTPGLMFYQGDLSGSSPDPRTTHLSAGFEVGYKPIKMVAFSVGYTFGQLSGNDAYVEEHKSRNLNFTTFIHDFRLLTFIDLNAIRRKIWPRKTVGRSDFEPSFTGPFFIAGIGYMGFNPRSEKDGETYQLQKLGTEGQRIPNGGYGEPYSLWAMNVKFGFGAGYNLTRQIAVHVQFLHNRTFTDFIDDVSGAYPDYNDMINSPDGETAAYFTYGGRDGSQLQEGQMRGNSVTNDSYLSFGISLVYTFGRSEMKRFINL